MPNYTPFNLLIQQQYARIRGQQRDAALTPESPVKKEEELGVPGGAGGLASGPATGPATGTAAGAAAGAAVGGTTGVAAGAAAGAAAGTATGAAAGAARGAGFPYPYNLSAAAAALMQMSMFRQQMLTAAIIKMMELCDVVLVKLNLTHQLEYWQKMASDYISETGVIHFTVQQPGTTDSRPLEFAQPVLARVIHQVTTHGLLQLEVHPSKIRAQFLSNDTLYLESLCVTMTHRFHDGLLMCFKGTVRAIFNPQLKVEWMDLVMGLFVPSVEWLAVKQIVASIDSHHSPELRLHYAQSQVDVFLQMSKLGFKDAAMRVMQILDVMSYMRPLMMYYAHTAAQGGKTKMGPIAALEQYVAMAHQSAEQAQRARANMAKRKADEELSPKSMDKKRKQ